jgi:hypothetical protein
VLPGQPSGPPVGGPGANRLPGTPDGFPPIPKLDVAGGVQLQHINNGGQGEQTMNNNGPTLADYNDAMRRRAADQLGNGASLKMSVHTGILQADGVTVIYAETLAGLEDKRKLSNELMIQIDHFKVPKLWQSWLRKYELYSTNQVGAPVTVEGLDKLFFSAQRSENILLGMADMANIRLFQATCIALKDMVGAPECSKEHAMMLKGLCSKLDCCYLLAHAINPASDEILGPNAALKLADELRREKPMVSIYPLTRMRTAADANDGSPIDEGVYLVNGALKRKDIYKIKMADLHAVYQRIGLHDNP